MLSLCLLVNRGIPSLWFQVPSQSLALPLFPARDRGTHFLVPSPFLLRLGGEGTGVPQPFNRSEYPALRIGSGWRRGRGYPSQVLGQATPLSPSPTDSAIHEQDTLEAHCGHAEALYCAPMQTHFSNAFFQF